MTEAPPTPSPVRLHKALDALWRTPGGLGRLTAVNHTILGRRFIVTAITFFLIGGVLAMLVRAQLATPHSAFMDAETYNQVFTMHGTVMMFLFAIPLFEGLAIYMLPKMLGARDLAFPRITAYGYWCYLFGGSIILLSFVFGVAPDAGWFLYTPLSSRPFTPGINSDVWLIGVTFVEISAIAAAVEIIVSILKVRAPGMSLDRLPLFAWYMLVTAFMMLVGFPPLILASILLEVERAFDWPFFDPTRGGDSLLWQHLFWLFGHPEVYIIFLPAAGAVSTVLPVLCRREIVGYVWIVVAIIALAFLSFGLWVHHMFTVGIPHLALGFFSAASMLVAVPTAVQIFAWIATMLAGRPQLKLPMLYIFGFFFVFVLGGLTGVMLAVVPFNWQVHDTHFVVAHLHYVLVGGFIFPMLAAAYYWLPHFTGRASVHSFGVPAFWLIFIGFNVTFFGMHWTGLLGMPRRIFTYGPDAGWEWLNLISSLGAFLMAIGFALFVMDVLLHRWFGQRSARNPWQAGTLEWATITPPPTYNFASLPAVDGRYPLTENPDRGRALAAGNGYLGFTRNNWLETLGVHMTSGKLEQVIVLPSQTSLPLWSALATGLFFVAVLFQQYLVALTGVAAALITFLLWTRQGGLRRDHGPLPVGRGEQAVPHSEAAEAPSWWGMVFILVANATLFASLLFSVLFLWIVAPGWPPPQVLASGHGASLVAAMALVFAAWAGRQAIRDNAQGSGRRVLSLWFAALGSFAAMIALSMLMFIVPDPTGHAYAATMRALIIYCAIHAGISVIFALFGWWRCLAGYVSPARSVDLRIGELWHYYTATTGLITLLLVHGISRGMG